MTIKLKSGQAIIESLVGLSVAAVGLLGVFELVSHSIGVNRQIADQYIAANLASEGIEIVKNIIDSNSLAGNPWNNGLSDGVYEISYNSTALGNQLSSSPADCTNIFIKTNGTLLTYDPATGLYGYGLPKPTYFKRAVCIQNLSSGEEIKINSFINWTGRGSSAYEINLEDHFFNWRQI